MTVITKRTVVRGAASADNAPAVAAGVANPSAIQIRYTMVMPSVQYAAGYDYRDYDR